MLFNFAAPVTDSEALAGVDRLFLLRLPQVTDVKRLLLPVIVHALPLNVPQIVFLSLQGAGFTNCRYAVALATRAAGRVTRRSDQDE